MQPIGKRGYFAVKDVLTDVLEECVQRCVNGYGKRLHVGAPDRMGFSERILLAMLIPEITP